MELAESLVAGAQAAEVVQPGEAALDHPAFLAEAGAVLCLATGDHRLDPARPELAAVLVVVIAAIGEQRRAGGADPSCRGPAPDRR